MLVIHAYCFQSLPIILSIQDYCSRSTPHLHKFDLIRKCLTSVVFQPSLIPSEVVFAPYSIPLYMLVIHAFTVHLLFCLVCTSSDPRLQFTKTISLIIIMYFSMTEAIYIYSLKERLLLVTNTLSAAALSLCSSNYEQLLLVYYICNWNIHAILAAYATLYVLCTFKVCICMCIRTI